MDESISEGRVEDVVAQFRLTDSLFMFKRFFKYVFMCRGRKFRKESAEGEGLESRSDSIGSKIFYWLNVKLRGKGIQMYCGSLCGRTLVSLV